MKIIVGVDFSKSSDIAMDVAVIWGKKFISEIFLVHAYLPTAADTSVPIGVFEAAQANLQKEYETILEQKSREIQEKGIKCHYKVVISDLRNALEEVNSEFGAGLIMLGRTTRQDFLDRMIGSTSQNLLNGINLPLLIIPDSYKPKGVSSIVYATSLEFDEKPQLNAVKEIKDKFNAEIDFVKMLLISDLDINPDRTFIEDITQIFSINENKVTYRKADSLKSGLNEFIEEKNADLLILISRKRGFLDGLLSPSRSKKLITKFDIPILIYHF
jgi:nucleotide-binding universal stress UspA family protein